MTPPSFYEITIEGQLGAEWSAWFEGLEIRQTGQNETLLSGPVADQAALYGLLKKVRDLGLPLIAVKRLKSELPGLEKFNPS
jgi:hypothetical protein